MKKIGVVTWMLLFLYFFTRAQDVTFPGSSACPNPAVVSGTWEVPCGVTEITVEVYGGGGGAGGGGGGSDGGSCGTAGGGGGGSGAYTTLTFNVTPGTTFSYSAGASGCGGGNGDNYSDGDPGNNGGNSSFSGSGINLVANGGIRGTEGESCGLFGSGTGDSGNGGAGGVASGGSTNTNGVRGDDGMDDFGGNGGDAPGPDGGAGGSSNGANGSFYGGGGAGGGDSDGGRGAPGGILITYTATTTIPVPEIDTIAGSCSADGSASVANYDVAYTYQVSPAGTVEPGGAISGLTPGTSYTVQAAVGPCFETSDPFSIDPATPLPDPVIDTIAASCMADGSATVINYNSALMYSVPGFPTVQVIAGGAITGLTPGTSYMVEATDANCPAPSTSDPFSIDAQFPAPVASFSGSLSYCADSNTTLTASGGETYLWTDINSNIISNTAIAIVTQGDYTVVVTDSNGCTDAATASVTEIQGPSITLTGDPMQICAGQSVTFTASLLTNPNNPLYEFYVNGTLAQSGAGETYTTTALAQGDTVTVRAQDNGCFGPMSDDVAVTVLQVGTSIISLTGFPTDICAGQSVTFTATFGFPEYEFFLNGTSVQIDTFNTYTTTLSQGADVTARAADQTGCYGPFSDTVTITILPFGPATVTLTEPDPVCAGQPVTFRATPAIYDTYEFLVNGVPVQTGALDTFVTTTLVQGDTVTARAADLGCFGQESPSVSVTILQEGTATVNLIPSKDSICPNELVMFTAEPSTYSAYEFLRNGNVVQSGPSNTYTTTTLAATDTITARALDQGCFGPESNPESVFIRSSITVGAGLDIDFCPGNDAVILEGFSPPGGTWSGTGITDASGVFNPQAAGSGQHTLTYSFIDTSGCQGSDDIVATVFSPAPADFSASPLIADITDNTPIVFTDLTNGATGWLWDFGDDGSSIEQNPSHIYSDTGLYTVTLITTDINGCSDTIEKPAYILVHEGVGAHVPNAFSPDGNSINDVLRVYGKGIDNLVLRVFNRWGELVFETRDVNGAWDGKYNGRELSPDVYVYTLYVEFLDFTSERQKGSVTLMR